MLAGVAVLGTVSVVDALAQRVREQVLDGEIASGAPVAETEVAAAFGVSRPTAKSAIITLVHSGLLRRDSHRPAYVPQLTAADITDLYRVRIPLEAEAVRGLARERTALPSAHEAVEDLARLADDAPVSRFIATDLRFHRALIEQSGSPRLERLYATILDEVHLAMRQARRALGRERIAREHTAVLDAIAAGDADRAINALCEHLTGAGRSLAEAISD